MKKLTIILISLCICAVQSRADSDILWDNGDWEGGSNNSSERNTLVTESWSVDDFIITEPVVIREFLWTSLMRDDMNALGSDLIILNEAFETIAELSDLSFSRVFDGTIFGEFEIYHVTLSGLAIELQPGRYFIGGRMVGDGTSRAVSGMNSTIRGESAMYFQSDHFGYPDWTQLVGLDVAFKVYGDIIPTPPTLLALTLPGLLALRRRR